MSVDLVAGIITPLMSIAVFVIGYGLNVLFCSWFYSNIGSVADFV
jgi:hypothetical protein